MKILFMDDSPRRVIEVTERAHPLHQIEIVMNVQDALSYLSNVVYDIVYLDHDMNGEKRVRRVNQTGTQVAMHIAELPVNKRPKQVIIHSKFDWGAARMFYVLDGAGVPVKRHRFDAENFGVEMFT